MNTKLFRKLNESLANPVRKNSIVITEEDEKNFIFGSTNNILANVLTEDFDRDEYSVYITAAESRQKDFDARRMHDKAYASKKEVKAYEKEQKKIDKEKKKEQHIADKEKRKEEKDRKNKRIQELEQEIRDNQEVTAAAKAILLSKLKEVENKKEAIEQQAESSSSSLPDRQKVLSTYMAEVNTIFDMKEKNGLKIDLIDAVGSINREPAYSSVPNAVKQATLNKAKNSI